MTDVSCVVSSVWMMVEKAPCTNTGKKKGREEGWEGPEFGRALGRAILGTSEQESTSARAPAGFPEMQGGTADCC